MGTVTWIFYLLGAALVFGSWVGWVNPTLGWVGWAMATGIAVISWMQGSRRKPLPPPAQEARPVSEFSREELDAARGEVASEDDR